MCVRDGADAESREAFSMRSRRVHETGASAGFTSIAARTCAKRSGCTGPAASSPSSATTKTRNVAYSCVSRCDAHFAVPDTRMRKLITGDSSYEEAWGYSRAVVDGEWVFVSGTTGFDYATMAISDDPAEQTRQCFRTISQYLAQAGCSLTDVVRIRTTCVTQRTGRRLERFAERYCITCGRRPRQSSVNWSTLACE